MNKLFITIFFILFQQVNYLSSSDRIDEFKMQLQDEKIHFLSSNIHDIESIKTMIFTMYKLDQAFRMFYINDRNNPDIKKIMIEIDQFHTGKMQEIITRHGWLTIEQFGSDTDHQAWLLVQHSSDLEFQKNCLQLLTQAMQFEQTNPVNYAYLYDRVALQLQEYDYKQRYGTQFHVANTGQFILQPYEGTLEDIDKYRLLIGLSSLEKYTAHIQNMYTK